MTNWPFRRNPDSLASIGGKLGNGTYQEINASPEGHLEVEIHGPVTGFGELQVSNNIPVLQGDFVYGNNADLWEATQQGSGVVSNANGMATCTTAANANSLASIRSKHVLRYRAGQGALGRFTAMWSAAAAADPAGASTTAGFGTSESGIFVGYIGGYGFGIVHNVTNTREIEVLEVTSASSNVQTATITLAGVAYSVSLTATGTVTGTAKEIAAHSYNATWPGWTAEAVGDKVYFVATQAGNQTGTFSASFPSSGAATFSELVAGALGTTDFIPQASWSDDTMLGDGGAGNPSGQELSTTNLNVFFVSLQYLGAGEIQVGIEDKETGELTIVHRIKRANSYQVPSLKNPGFPFQLSSRNVTHDGAIAISAGSVGGFIQGPIRRLGVQKSYMLSKTGITTTLTPLFSIRAGRVFNSKVSTAEIIPATLRLANAGNKAAEIYVYENATLDAAANFSLLESGVSVAQIDTSATSVSGGTQKFAVPVGPLNTASADLAAIDGIIEAGGTITIAAKAVSTTVDITASLQWWEDQ